MTRTKRLQRRAYLVRIDLDGRVVCPAHGRLGPSAEYEAGRAKCGCIFRAVGKTMMLRRQAASFMPDVAGMPQQRPESAALTCNQQLAMA